MSPRTATLAAAIAVASALPYAGTLRHGPTYDDHHHVVRHPLLDAPAAGLASLLTGRYLDVEQPDRARPVYLASLLLDRLVTAPVLGRAFAAHRLGSVAVHGAVAGLLFLLLLRLGVGRAPAALGALLFGVHPACTEGVASVSNREDPLAALFVLAAILSSARALRAPDPRTAAPWVAGAGLAFALALGSKESALAGPLLLGWLAVASPEGFRGPRRRWVALGAVGALALVAFTALQVRLGAPALAIFAGGAPLERGPTQLALPWASGWESAVPIAAARVGRVIAGAPLSAEHDPRPLASPLAIAAGAVALLAILGVCVEAWPRRRRIAIALGWILIASLPVLPSPWLLNPMADRYLYLPATLGVGLLGACLARAPGRGGGILLAALLAAATSATAARAAVWRDDVALFEDAVAHAPSSPRARIDLGAAYLREGRLGDAAIALERAVALDPSAPAAHYDLGLVWLRRGDVTRARDAFGRAAQLPTARGERALHDRAFRQWIELLHRTGERDALVRAVRVERRTHPDSRTAAIWWTRLSARERAGE